MQKGITSESEKKGLTYLKNGESITVGVISLDEGVGLDVVSVYDNDTQTSIISGTALKQGQDSLYHDLVELLWSDYNVLIESGMSSKDPKPKELLKLINMIKPMYHFFFGFRDINTGEDVILPMKFKKQMKADDKPSAGNNLMNGLAQCKDYFKTYPLTLTKGAMGAWQVMPMLSPLNDSQKEHFANTQELSLDTYLEAIYFSTPETEIENIKKFAEHFNYDISRLNLPSNDETVESKGESYGF